MNTPHPILLQFNRRRLMGNVAALFSGSAIAQGATALALLLTARQLGVEMYGQYAACLVLASVSGVVYNLGLDIWLLREGGKDQANLGEKTASVMGIKIVGGLAWSVLLVVVAPRLRPDVFPPLLLAFSALSVLLDNLFAAALAAFKASLRNNYTFALDAVTDLAWLAGTVLLIAAAQSQALAFMQVRVGVQAVGLLAALWLVRRLFGLSPRRTTVRLALQKAFPYAGSEFLASAAMRLDVLLIALILGKSATGLYSPAVGIVNALFLIPAALYIVMVPVLTKLLATHPRQAWLTATRSIALSALVGIGLFAALAVGARPLVTLLGDSYSAAQPILQLLSVILLLHSISFMMAAILVAGELQSQRMVVQAAALGVNILLNLILLPLMGISGAAWAYIASDLVLLAGYSWLVVRFRKESASGG
jgi:O-antigen/teichoic acid export membrane protein